MVEKNVNNLADKICIKINFDAKLDKSKRQCLFLNKTTNLLSTEGVTYDAVQDCCVTNHLSLFVGASLPDSATTTGGTTTSTGSSTTTTTPNAKAIDGMINLPYLVLIFISVLGYVLIA